MQTRHGPRGSVLAILTLVFACFSANLRAASAETDPLRNRLSPPVVAAHRGGDFVSGSPIDKVRATLRAGTARVLEIDLRLTRDGVVVVSHDEQLSTSGSCAGNVSTFTYAALTACSRAIDGEPMARFIDVLNVVRGQAVVNAEFKTHEVIAPAIGIVEAWRARSWVYFQTKSDLTTYRIARSIDADIALLVKVNSDEEIRQAIALRDPHLVILELDRDFITPQRVSRIHEAHMLVSEDSFRYQFTEERFIASCDRVFGPGVDIAVTNNPASCSAQRGTWRNGSGESSNPFDRQHLRADFGGNKYALELFFGGIGMLGIALMMKARSKTLSPGSLGNRRRTDAVVGRQNISKPQCFRTIRAKCSGSESRALKRKFGLHSPIGPPNMVCAQLRGAALSIVIKADRVELHPWLDVLDVPAAVEGQARSDRRYGMTLIERLCARLGWEICVPARTGEPLTVRFAAVERSEP